MLIRRTSYDESGFDRAGIGRLEILFVLTSGVLGPIFNGSGPIGSEKMDGGWNKLCIKVFVQRMVMIIVEVQSLSADVVGLVKCRV